MKIPLAFCSSYLYVYLGHKNIRMINFIYKKVCNIFLTFVGCGISECQIRLSILIPAPDRGGQFAEISGLINHMGRSECFI